MKDIFEFKVLNNKDAVKIASIHVRAFKNFFLTSLGEKFLIVFYEAILKNIDGIGIGVTHNQELIGFAIGTTKVQGFYKNLLKKNFFKLSYAASRVLIMNPKKIFMLIQSFGNQKYPELEDSSILLSISLLPSYRSKGIGRELIKNFEQLLYQKNKKSIILTTDAINNDKTNEFYKEAGYELIETLENKNGRRMNLYKKNITNNKH